MNGERELAEITERCDNCEQPFDRTRHRWRCPHCGYKATCCEGAPQ